jgi:2-polyprenyl-3-methyl-5-hydroxy-6-metoxy-1,4-benzoquinol methylase
MIIHKLIAQHFKHRDDPTFYFFQAQDAVRWIEQVGGSLGAKTRVLDLGCGHGVFGAQLVKRGCPVTFADEEQGLLPEIANAPFRRINLDRDDVTALGEYDLVICSNVLEHLAKPKQFLDSVHSILSPAGKLYLSWTNWLSPWGGHEFSPFHYLGATRGHLIYDKLLKRKRKHTPFENLYPTYIGEVLKMIRQSPGLAIIRAAPRYYTEFSFLIRIPILREFLTWNCALLLGRKASGRP